MIFDYEKISDKQIKILSKISILSENLIILSLKTYSYIYILIGIFLEMKFELMHIYLFSMWLLGCILFNITDVRRDIISESIEDYREEAPEEPLDPVLFFSEVKNTEGWISLLINIGLIGMHFYFSLELNIKYACIALVLRLILKDFIKRISLPK